MQLLGVIAQHEGLPGDWKSIPAAMKGTFEGSSGPIQ